MKLLMVTDKTQQGIVRKPIYVHKAQLQVIDEICRVRCKPKSIAFLEAIQLYIGAYKEGEI